MVSQKHKIQKLVEKWAKALEIENYKISVHILTPEEMDNLESEEGGHEYAQVITSEDRQEVDLYINSHYLKEEPHETINTIVHELLHVKVNELMEFVVDGINSYVSDLNAKKLLMKQFGKLEHKLVVSLTRALISEDK